MRIIDTDNFGGDYPNENFHLLCMPKEMAEKICAFINEQYEEHFGLGCCARYFMVVPDDYQLKPGFEA